VTRYFYHHPNDATAPQMEKILLHAGSQENEALDGWFIKPLHGNTSTKGT
jgi:hypothetical protein